MVNAQTMKVTVNRYEKKQKKKENHVDRPTVPIHRPAKPIHMWLPPLCSQDSGRHRRRSGPARGAEGEDRAMAEKEIHAARARGEPRHQHNALDPPLPQSLLDLAATIIAGSHAGPRPGSAIAKCHLAAAPGSTRAPPLAHVDLAWVIGSCHWTLCWGSTTTMAWAEVHDPHRGERLSLASSDAPPGESVWREG